MKSLRECFWWGIFAIVALLGLAAAGSHYAKAAETCMPFEKAVGALEKQYQEQMIGAGVSVNNDYVYQLFAHRTGRSWTLIRTDKKGITCFMAAGTDWSEIDAWSVQPQSIDHHEGNPPHSWIRPKKNGMGISCCGEFDIVEIPHWKAAEAVPGSKITATFPTQGEMTITVKRVYPTEDGKSYLTKYGCVFKPFSM